MNYCPGCGMPLDGKKRPPDLQTHTYLQFLIRRAGVSRGTTCAECWKQIERERERIAAGILEDIDK